MKLPNIFQKNRDDTPPADDTAALHKYSGNARARTELFKSVLSRDCPNYQILPGRYGGEYNNDMLALGETKDGGTALVLGIKLSDNEGGLQMDEYSLGPFNQFSDHWLDALVAILSIPDETKPAAEKIRSARENQTLITSVIFLLKNKNNSLSVLRVECPNKDAYD